LRNRAISVIAATAVALAAAIASATVASANEPTITITVQLTDPFGAALTTLDSSARIGLREISGAGDIAEYAAATPDAVPGSETYVGTVTDGVATFTDVPASQGYEVEANASPDYGAVLTSEFKVKTTDYTKDVALKKLASISGTLTGPGGTPIEGAVVRAIGDGEHYATTDADGDYSLVGLQSHAYKIEFNSHWTPDADNTNLVNSPDATYTWSYWPAAATTGKATPILVQAQSTARKNPTVKVGINGSVAVSHTVTLTIDVPSAVGSTYGYLVNFVHKTSGVLERNVVANSPSVTVPLNAGSYLVSVTILNSEHEKTTVLWYHGDGRVGVTHSHASTLAFTGLEDVTYSFGVPEI
jgi:hypothetical protein